MLSKTFLAQLSKHQQGKVHLPGSEGYKTKVRVYNRAVKKTPLAVVTPLNKNDVIAIVKLANKHKVPLSVKGGGHNTAGSSVQSNTMVLDMCQFKHIAIRPAKKKARVEAGVLNGELDLACEPYQLALPLGTCNSVGVIGSTLGGGVGFLSRKLGLVIDNVIKFEIVTGKGELLSISKDDHPDLFWGLRGAGAGHFGIVISAEYKLWQVPKKVFGGTVSWPLNAGRKILGHYFDVMKQGDQNTFLYAYTGRSESGKPVVSLFGVSIQSEEQSRALFDSFLALAQPVERNLGSRSYYELQSGHYKEGLAIYWKNHFVKGHPKEAIDSILEAMSACPEYLGGIMLDPMGGEIKSSPENDSAFAHRDNDYILSVTGIYPGDAVPLKTQQWVNDSMQVLKAYCQSTSYQNYEDKDISTHSQYFAHDSARLSDLKKKYDPNQLMYGILSKTN